MKELLTTVRNRYGRIASYRGLTTLVYREKAAAADSTDAAGAQEHPKRGFMGFLRPHLQGISKKLQDEVQKILDRRDKLLSQSVMRDMPQMIERNTLQLRSDRLKFEKAQTGRSVRLESASSWYTQTPAQS